MTLDKAKKEVDHTLASLFYDRMKGVRSGSENATQTYKQAALETSELLLHMKGRLEVLFGQDSEALAQFLAEAGITPTAQ